MTKKIICPICESRKSKQTISLRKYSIYTCLNCDGKFLRPFPTTSELERFYQKEYFTGKHGGVSGYKDYKALEQMLVLEAKKRLQFIKTITNKKKLLDLGSGTGDFLKVAKDMGYKASGNDISDHAVKQLKMNGIKTYPGIISNKTLPKKSFEIITAWDVIEHLPNIQNAVKAISDALVPGGYFILTTPNTNSIDAKILGKNWYGYKKIPEHLLYFNEKSIEYIFKRNNLDIVVIRNWGFIRTLGFVAEKLTFISSFFKPLPPLIKKLGVEKKYLFFPLTDFIVVAQKKH